jgi:hypothetical protein
MIRASWTNPTVVAMVATMPVATIASGTIGWICPSVCPSDWDKHKTLFVSPFVKATYEKRFKIERRGQDSLDVCLLRHSQLQQLLIYQAITTIASTD